MAEDLAGLQQLDPSPVEDSPYETNKESYFPVDDTATTTPPVLKRSDTFGLNSHSAPWYLVRIQKYSSYAFSIFSAFHIANTSIIPLITQSVPASEPYLLLTRPYYQSPVAEPLLIGIPLFAHVAAGVALRVYRRRQQYEWYGAESRKEKRQIPWPKVSGSSKLGYLLIPLLAGHSFINRGLPLIKEGGSSSINLGYVSHAFAKYPAMSFVGFASLITVGVLHTTWGWAKWLGLTPELVTQGGEEGRLSRKKRWYLINAASAVIAGLWTAGGLGVVGRGGKAGGWVGREYDELYRSIPLIGKWM